MTTSQGSEYRDDSFAFWNTDVLMEICFRVTPAWEQENWVITSRDERYELVGQMYVERYDRQALRTFAVEQLEDYGITVHDINNMKS